DSTQRTIAKDEEQAVRHVLNLNYEWRIDTTGKKLNIDADYFSRNEDNLRHFNTQSFFADGGPVTALIYHRTTAMQYIDISSVKADVVLPYRLAELSFGAKTSFVHTISDNRFYTQ